MLRLSNANIYGIATAEQQPKQQHNQQPKQLPKKLLKQNPKQHSKQQLKQTPMQWPKPLVHIFPSYPLQKMKWVTTMTTTTMTTYTISRDDSSSATLRVV